MEKQINEMLEFPTFSSIVKFGIYCYFLCCLEYFLSSVSELFYVDKFFFKYINFIYLLFNFLQGDFLLIVLKNLIEKQSTNSSGKLKIILMYVFLCLILFLELVG